MIRALLASVLCLSAAARAQPAVPDDLLTVAERSNYTATARYAEVIALLDRLADAERPGALPGAALARRGRMGFSFENREIPLLIIADPPVRTPDEAEQSGKVILFAFGNIHAGEVCGKEALPVLARDILSNPAAPENRALLSRAVLVLAPIYNTDGNERVSKDNRPGQVGPSEGMGQRPNAQGFDLNRDYVRLEAPETRAMVSFLHEWRPHLIVDTHTTNGSKHRWTITYEAPLHAASHPAPVAFVRSALLPEAARRLKAAGYDAFWYGELSDDSKEWRTYSGQARFGGNYHGLIGRASVLSEAYAYAPYKDRVLATTAFVRACFDVAAERAEALREACARAEADTESRGAEPGPDDLVPLTQRIAAFPEPVTFLGYEAPRSTAPREENPHRPQPEDTPAEWPVTHFGRFEAAASVPRPLGYLVPMRMTRVIETLGLHGLRSVPLEDAMPIPALLRVETHVVTASSRSERPFQGARLVTLETERRPATRTFTGVPRAVRDINRMREGGGRGAPPPPGPDEWLFVPTAQPLGTLAVILLEPMSEDGLATWGFFNDAKTGEPPAPGQEFPVLRVLGTAR